MDATIAWLAKNKDGIGEMCRLLTKHNFDKTPLPIYAPNFNNVFVIYPIENIPVILKENEFIGMRHEQLLKLFKSEWKTKIQKIVIFHPVTFRTKKEFNLHKILRAIDTNIILSKLTTDDYCKTTEVMLPLEDILVKYKDYPEIIKNTERLIEDCNFEFDFNASYII